jgi:hypothetical protein
MGVHRRFASPTATQCEFDLPRYEHEAAPGHLLGPIDYEVWREERGVGVLGLGMDPTGSRVAAANWGDDTPATQSIVDWEAFAS